MSRLFIELYLDEDVNVLIAALLRSHGYVAVTLREAGQLHQGDADQLAYATSLGKAILTHNRADFEALAQAYYAAQQTHYGVILAARRSPYQILRRLLPILNSVTANEMRSQLRYI